MIRQVLPNEGGRIADENTLLVTDILVEFEDGSLADVEIQKLGYAFPGERSACYAADLLLRQYKRARDKRNREKGKFSYKDIKNVYAIVLLRKALWNFILWKRNICINLTGALIQGWSWIYYRILSLLRLTYSKKTWKIKA